MAYLLRDPQVIEYALDRLDPDQDFTDGELAHKLLWIVSSNWYRDQDAPIGREHLLTELQCIGEKNPDIGFDYITEQIEELINDAYEPDRKSMAPQHAIMDLLQPWLDRRYTNSLKVIMQQAELGGYTDAGELFDSIGQLADEARARGMGSGNGLGRLVKLSDVESEEVDWLWRERLAKGEMHLVAGEPGTCKSFMTMDLAARVSTGAPWPDEPGKTREPADVIILSAEDSINKTIAPRLRACGADDNRIHIHESDLGGGLNMKDHVVPLCRMIERIRNPALLIIDPVGAFFGKTDTHRDSEVREVLAKVQTMAAKNNMAVLLVAHLNKNENQKAINRVNGSIGLLGAVRMGWLVIRDKDEDGLRHLAAVKNNLGPERSGLSYRLSEQTYGVVVKRPRIDWDNKPLTMSADELMRPNKALSKRDEAAALLLSALKDGPQASADIMKVAREAKISLSTVMRAKTELNIKTAPGDFQGGWVWMLPEHAGRKPKPEPISLNDGDTVGGPKHPELAHLAKPICNQDETAAKLRVLADRYQTNQHGDPVQTKPVSMGDTKVLSESKP